MRCQHECKMAFTDRTSDSFRKLIYFEIRSPKVRKNLSRKWKTKNGRRFQIEKHPGVYPKIEWPTVEFFNWKSNKEANFCVCSM
jgi:hypothetical protein